MIIAGSRDFCDILSGWTFIDTIHENHPITEVVCGMAKGGDTCGKFWGQKHNIPVKEFPANWKKFGQAAGPIRNKEMAVYADAAIVIHGGSRGSLNMIQQMKKLGKPIYEWRYQ